MAANANAIRAGSAFVEFFVEDGKFRRAMEGIEKKAHAIGGVLKSVGTIGMGVGGAITAPFAAAIKIAADAQEGVAKFGAVFGEQTKPAKEFAEVLSSTVGRSLSEVMDAMSSFQGFFVGLGFGGEQARGFSQQMQALALDFAAFHNLSDDDAIGRFISALSGSGEVLDRYGINIKQAALEQELLRMGVKKSWTEVTEQEKAVARLNLIMQGMTAQGAVGAAVRESGSFANQLKALQAKIRDVAIEVGTVLLPVTLDLIGQLSNAVTIAANWASENTALVKVIAIAGGSLVALGATLYTVGTAFTVVGTAAGATSAVLTFLAANPIVLVLTAVGATIGWLVAEFYRANDAVTSFDQALKGLDGKRTFGDPDDVQALIQRYEQLAAKSKLTAEEQREAWKVMHGLRMEFGDLAVGQSNGRLTNVDQVKAQIQAARQGKSIGLQKQAIGQAEAAMATRKAEGADAAELAERAKGIAEMNAELERTQRIVKDAAPTAVAAPSALPAPVLSAKAELAAARSAMTPAMERAVAASTNGAAAASRMAMPPAAAAEAVGGLSGADVNGFRKLVELETKALEKLTSIERKVSPPFRMEVRGN